MSRGLSDPARSRGMTLVELLVAMALLASLGALVVQLMRNSFELYAAGERRGEYAANAMVALDRLDDDLRNVVADPDGRFVLEQRGGAGTDVPALVLRLVRTTPQGEMRHPVLRVAGTKAQAAAAYSGRDPGPAARSEIGAPTNLIEVCYALVQDPAIDAGVMTLYRAERAPAYQPGATFFDAERGEIDSAWVRANMDPVSTGVLALHLLCRGPATEDWNEESLLESGGAAAGALISWDSTRAILPASTFGMAVGEGSLGEPRDDVFPSHVRAVLVMARPGRPDAKLGSRLVGGVADLTVDRADRLPRAQDEDRYVKVGFEWMEIRANAGYGAQVARGRRRSGGNTTYETGTPVYAGKTFRRTSELPPSPPPSLGAVR
jgi:prepilin-type N-terminal cleavage/methylation domain-containing protein